MPGSFDSPLMINAQGCLTPSGPLGLAAGETVLRLDIWIWQDRAACMAFLPGPEGEMDERPPGRWTMTPDPDEDHFGEMFQPGPAIGMGLMVKKNAKGEVIVEQWNRPILLQ
jgi:hypothetical protein